MLMLRDFVRVGMILLAVFLLAGCVETGSSAIGNQFLASGRQSVNLATAVPGDWERVCVLGPYSDNTMAAKTLGFAWPAETLTEISHDDGITLLVFVRGTQVISFEQQIRSIGDFSNLSGQCFPRARTSFVQVPKPAGGWPGLFPVDATPPEGGTPDAAAGVYPQLRNLKAVPRPVIPTTEVDCKAVDGYWGPQGLPGGGPVCSLKTSDRYKICTDSEQCQGVCLVQDDLAVGMEGALGSCAEWDRTYGCHKLIVKGKVESWCGH
jgi:hypothetical protein